MGNIEIFERMASGYDTAERVSVTKIITAAIRRELDGLPHGSAMDYGCGTGLVGLELADVFDHIMLVDASSSMIERVQNKIDASKVANATAISADLCTELSDLGKFDVIMTSQVLLHIRDFSPLIERFHAMLNEGGCLIIVDFDKNDKIVSDMVQNGFDRTELMNMLENCGFVSIHSSTFHHGKNMFMGQNASLFIMSARKPSLDPRS